MPPLLTPLTDPDLLLSLNESGLPNVNRISHTKAEWLLAHAAVARLALLEEQPAGAVVVLDDQSQFDSDYFRWYTQRYSNFLYIDRVMVAEWARGQGVASCLYQAVDEYAHQHSLAIASEVYADPPNVPSLNLHTKFGFFEIGRQFVDYDQKWVVKLFKNPERAILKNLDQQIP